MGVEPNLDIINMLTITTIGIANQRVVTIDSYNKPSMKVLLEQIDICNLFPNILTSNFADILTKVPNFKSLEETLH